MYQPTQEIKKHYLALALVCLGFIALSFALQTTNGGEWASMSIRGIDDGELWRLVTGHLIHIDWHHFGMNMTGLVLCIIVFRDDVKAWHWPASFLFISIFSSLCMYYTYFSYERYLGFSDVLHGWILVGAFAIAHKEPKFCAMIFVLFWMKILEENFHLTFFTSYGVSGNVAKESHIYGAIGGIIYALMFLPSFRQSMKKLARLGKPDNPVQ